MGYISCLFLSVAFCIKIGYCKQYADVTRLYDYVTADKYRYVRPEADLNTATAVSFKFHLSNLQEIDDNLSKFSIAGFFQIFWKDNNRTWDPSLYDNVDSIRVPGTEIWKPHLMVGNPYKKMTVIEMREATIRIDNNGQAYWHPAGYYEMACDADVSFFPFDTQTCEMWIIPWQHDVTEISLNVSQSTVDLTFFSQNPQWDYISSTLYVKSSWNSLHISLTFKRKPAFFMVNVIFPILLLGILNVFVFVLPVDSGERVGFGMTTLLAIAVFLTIVADSLPSTSSPRYSAVGVFLCLDLILSTLILICTILGLVIYHRDDSKPITLFWIRFMKVGKFCCSKKIFDTKVGDDTTPRKNVSSAGKKHPEIKWRDVGVFLDNVFLLVFSLLFFIVDFTFLMDIVVGVN